MIRTALEAAPVVEKAAEEVSKMTLGDAGITAALGYSVVFGGIVLLMVVIMIFGKLMANKKAPAKSEAPAPAPVAPAPVVETTADVGMKDGHRACNLYNVDDRTAAMLMAIVADQAGIPLNELRFISIKEL